MNFFQEVLKVLYQILLKMSVELHTVEYSIFLSSHFGLTYFHIAFIFYLYLGRRLVVHWLLTSLLPAGLPRSSKLPVLNLLTGQKTGFSPHRGDSLHQFRSNFTGPTGTYVRFGEDRTTRAGYRCENMVFVCFFFCHAPRPVRCSFEGDIL